MDISNRITLANIATTNLPAGFVCRGCPQQDQLGQCGHHGHPCWDCVLWLSPTRSVWPMWPPRTSPLGLCRGWLGQRSHHGHPCWDCAVVILNEISLANMATTDIPTGIVSWISPTRLAWPMQPPRTSPLRLCAVAIPDGISLTNVAPMDIPAGIVCHGYPQWDWLGQRGHHGHPRWDCVQ